jgi:nucleoside-diphosphate-sugar epimerase
MGRILITGVTGFTGRHLAWRLSQLGNEVHGTVYGEAGEPIEAVTQLHRVDLADASAIERIIDHVSPEKVVHLAAIAFVGHRKVDEMYRTNIVGTRNLLAGLANAKSSLHSVLLASSAQIYGNAHEGVLDENTAVSPANDYAVTKAAAELAAQLYANRLPIIIVRPFNYTGRGQSPDFLIPKVVEHVRRGAAEIELGNIDVARDFSDVRGVVDAYARLVDEPKAIGGTFNVCSGHATSIRDILDEIRRVSGRELRVRVNPSFVRADEAKSLRGSAARLESIIGPLRMPPLRDTLRWMLED